MLWFISDTNWPIFVVESNSLIKNIAVIGRALLPPVTFLVLNVIIYILIVRRKSVGTWSVVSPFLALLVSVFISFVYTVFIAVE